MGNSIFFTIIFHKMDIINNYPMIWVIFKKKSFKPKNKLILKVTSRSFFGKKKRLAG
tara:strand:+ start:367 stop:537 length:171 start_codon:yes stop_codon:yes gene_type:complete